MAAKKNQKKTTRRGKEVTFTSRTGPKTRQDLRNLIKELEGEALQLKAVIQLMEKHGLSEVVTDGFTKDERGMKELRLFRENMIFAIRKTQI